ncbi:aminopeptidase [Candidatus Daviesbacteria bacterium]|nr:aminopeptidase [Candidatus Daviesbacteria bacterium]
MNKGLEYAFSLPQEPKHFNPAEIEKLAWRIVDCALAIGPDDILLVKYHPGAKSLMDAVCEVTLKRGAKILPLLSDPTKILAEKLTKLPVDAPLEVYGEMVLEERLLTEKANKFVGLFYDDDPRAMDSVDGRIRGNYEKARLPLKELSVGKRYFLIYLPTPQEAKLAGMSYGKYGAMCFRGYNRDWDKVETAQDILIERLNTGKYVEFYANEGLKPKWQTYVAMSIEGQTPWANSTFLRNIGSEIFTAPKAETVTGTVAAPYRLMFNNRMLHNLTLDFKGGKVVDFWTRGAEQRRYVRDMLETDEGACKVGEIGIGTNPEYDRPIPEPSKAEKSLGFHIGLGWSFPEQVYAGREVRIDNGNRSAVHIDVVNLMVLPWGGRVFLDERLIQENGVWLDPETGRPDPRLAIISAK